MSEMEYRENFWTWSVIHSISLLTMIVFITSIYANTTSINGWTHHQSLLVLGIGTLLSGLGSLTFFSFMYQFGGQIQRGEFDARLTRPVNVLFQSAICWVDIEDIVVVPTSLLLITYAIWKINPPHLFLNIFISLALIACSLFILFSVLTLIQSLAFKHIRVDSATNFYWSVVNIAKYPAKAIKNVSRLSLIFLTPIALISSVPAEALQGIFDIPWIISSLVFSVLLFITSYKVFCSSLRHYSSASS